MKTRILKFKDMPFDFQRSIVVYGGEDDIVNWTVIPAWAADNKVDWFDKDNVQIWIDDYSKVYANREFRIGIISIEDLKEKMMPVIEVDTEFETFEEYHKWYYDGTDHGDSVFPIVISNRECFDGHCEPIEDGWHRFHSYVHKGMENIPFVEYI